jgi:LSD1 subclass zinc finger protein
VCEDRSPATEDARGFGTTGSQGVEGNQSAGMMAHLVCGGCQQHLMYPRSAQSVLCASCHHVTPTAIRLGSP